MAPCEFSLTLYAQGEPGDNMGALLRGVKRDEIRRGQVIIAPGSMKAVTKFQAQVYVSIAVQSQAEMYSD
jgi:translation elongation factor EF-Tu-like GTPase